MKKARRKGIRKRIRQEATAPKVFIPHAPPAQPSFSHPEMKGPMKGFRIPENPWTAGHGPVRWSDVQRPATLRTPPLAPGFRENVSPAGPGIKPPAISQANRKKQGQDK